MKVIATTAGRPDQMSIRLAQEAADHLAIPFVDRKKRSVESMQNEYGAGILVAGKDRYEYFKDAASEPFFFHPNSAAFRLKRLLKGERDPFIEACGLQPGHSFLDCTLGLASDSIIASYITGAEGKVTGIEADPVVSFITKRGLKTFPASSDELKMAMDRILVIQSEAVEFLKKEADHCWDVVYIDTMFSTPIEESSNFTPLRNAGYHSELTYEWLAEASRVAKRRVVVKDRYDSAVFERHNMKRAIRPNIKFHFGVMEI